MNLHRLLCPHKDVHRLPPPRTVVTRQAAPKMTLDELRARQFYPSFPTAFWERLLRRTPGPPVKRSPSFLVNPTGPPGLSHGREREG